MALSSKEAIENIRRALAASPARIAFTVASRRAGERGH